MKKTVALGGITLRLTRRAGAGYNVLDADGKVIGHLRGVGVAEVDDMVVQYVEGEFHLPRARPSSPKRPSVRRSS